MVKGKQLPAPDITPETPMPEDLEAEMVAIGAALVEPGAAKIALDLLRPADFYPEAHRIIFAAIKAVAERGEPVDEITVGAELRRQGVVEKVGGVEYLTSLEISVPTAAHVATYAQLVKEKAYLREIISFASRIERVAYASPAASDFADLAEELLTGAQGFADRLHPADQGNLSADEYGKIARERTFFWPGWFPRGDLGVIGGDTGLGKSIDALYLAAALTGQVPWPDGTDPPEPGLKVFWCDCEGREWETWNRLNEWGLDGAPIIFPGADGTAAMSIDLGRPGAPEALAARAAGADCAGLVVDSLSASHTLNENSASEMGPMLKACKDAARKHDLGWFFTHHANKPSPLQGPEMTLDRLRGSSSIKQWAVSVIGVDQVIAGRDQPRRFRSLKLNFGKPPEDLGFSFEGDSSFPTWGAVPKKPVVLTIDEQAGQFLLDQLRAGPRLAADVWDASRTAGLGERAIRAAKKALNVITYQQGGAGQWWWRLP